MSKRWNRMETWLALVVVAVGVLLAAIAGLFGYMSATATPLHPEPQSVPSVTQSAPSPQWADAVERGRQIVRRASPSRTCRDCRWRSASVARSCGPKASAGRISRSGCPSRQSTRFRIGTASTVLTSAAVGLLLEKGG